MPVRRVVLERCLVEERVALWADLDEALAADDPYSASVSGLVRRIRSASEALGYPTDWLRLPMSALSWYRLVEDVPGLGITVETVDWDDARRSAEAHGVEMHYIDEDITDFHRWDPPRIRPEP